MAKSTKYEVQRRVNQVSRMLMNGVSRGDICQYMSETHALTDRQVDRYIDKANEAFAEVSKVDHAHEFGKALDRLNYLLNKNLQDADWKAALQVQKEINELHGLYAPKQTVNKNENVNIETSWEEMFKRDDTDS